MKNLKKLETGEYIDTVSGKELLKTMDYDKNGVMYNERYYCGYNLHRQDGPASIWYYYNGIIEQEEYYINGKLHREDGLAYISYHVDGTVYKKEYWVNGKQIIDEFQILVIESLGMK